MPDWRTLLVPAHPLLEIVLRGSVLSLALFLVKRFVMQRQAGAVSLADLLVIVLIADVSRNAFSNVYKSLTEGILRVLTIVGWNCAIDWLAFRSRASSASSPRGVCRSSSMVASAGGTCGAR